MSERQEGDSGGVSKNRRKTAATRAEKKPGRQRPGDVGRALRSVYDETLREEVPDDFSDLLGKLR